MVSLSTSFTALPQPLLPLLDGIHTAFVRAQNSLSPEAADLVEQMLIYAAEAEQRLAAQSERITELEGLTLSDALTGLLNRRGFEAAAARSLANALRHDEQGLVVYIDLDDFKGINDRFGHGAGDRVLKVVAERLSASVRSTDYVARLGGDEFVALFPRTEPAAQGAILRKLDHSFAASVPVSATLTLAVRASFGVAHFDRATSLDTLLATADRAMYANKKRKRVRAA